MEVTRDRQALLSEAVMADDWLSVCVAVLCCTEAVVEDSSLSANEFLVTEWSFSAPVHLFMCLCCFLD